MATRKTQAKPVSSKKAQLIKILSTKTGADAAAISEKLGWQAHTTRAAISGLKKAGYEVEAGKPGSGKPTRYRITASAEAASTGAPAANNANAG